MPRDVDADRNSFLQILLKLIPSEIIAVHVFLQGVMPRLLVPNLVITLLLVAITPAYLRWAMGVRSRPQLAISTVSLVVWIYALGQGPFRFIRPPWYEPWYGSALLALWTLVPPMFLAAQGERAMQAERSASPERPAQARATGRQKTASSRRR